MDHNMPGMNMTPPAAAGAPANHGNMAMTHMTFYWGKNSEILFSGWPGTRTGMYVLVLILVFIVSVLAEWLSNCRLSRSGSKSVSAGIVQTISYAIRVGLAYLLMLAVMSFNVGVLIVAIVGHAVGFLVFTSRVFRDSYDSDKISGVHTRLAC
ncbi:copper transporter 6-like [Impatiens glandulifera]|uniref:copper transporter 6-like n=1 Tax=Impatiens glandulifera TaxID=253017 RepID=UPI001FB14207|nr:copper transporter 6-like [Impatiens glandulifera]